MPFDEDTNFNVYVGSENGILKGKLKVIIDTHDVINAVAVI